MRHETCRSSDQVIHTIHMIPDISHDIQIKTFPECVACMPSIPAKSNVCPPCDAPSVSICDKIRNANDGGSDKMSGSILILGEDDMLNMRIVELRSFGI